MSEQSEIQKELMESRLDVLLECAEIIQSYVFIINLLHIAIYLNIYK